MCGICGIVGSKASGDTTVINRMVATLAHRGPDGHGVLAAGECQLGHARLSIIDIEGGVQPMKDVSRRYSITFNGEIYNYRELRADLEKRGRAFETHSDNRKRAGRVGSHVRGSFPRDVRVRGLGCGRETVICRA